MKASEDMEKQGSAKSPSSGEQGGDLTPIISGWVANAAVCLWSHHKAGNGLLTGPHAASAILFSMKPSSLPVTNNSRRVYNEDWEHKTTDSSYLCSLLTAAALALGDAGVKHNR